MIKLHKLVASVGGIGYIKKGGGTAAAVLVCVIYFFIPAGYLTDVRQFFLLVVVTTIGIWSGNVVDGFWGKDSSKVVIDELAGMMISLLFIPLTWKYILAALILFRFFDIAKPLYIRKMEKLPKGFGVMADDVLAGLYSLILMQVIRIYHVF